jgi:hypothetical protein
MKCSRFPSCVNRPTKPLVSTFNMIFFRRLRNCGRIRGRILPVLVLPPLQVCCSDTGARALGACKEASKGKGVVVGERFVKAWRFPLSGHLVLELPSPRCRLALCRCSARPTESITQGTIRGAVKPCPRLAPRAAYWPSPLTNHPHLALRGAHPEG